MNKLNHTDLAMQNTEDKFIPIYIDAMFSKVMKNEEACKQTLEAILGFEIEKIEYINQEQEIDAGVESKSIRADVYAKEDGKVYDIEMQNYTKPDLVKRMRYYQSAIDTSELEKGVTYDKLPETFVIFICTFDMFDKGHAKYEFEVNCTNHKDVEADFGQHFVALNTTAYRNLEDGSLRSLLEYINDGTVNSDKLSKTLNELVKDANNDKEWVSGVWEGLSKEETLAIELESWKQEAEEIEAARAAEAKAREAEIKFTDTLLDQNRIDDLKRASKNSEFKQKLMEELGIL